MPTAKCCICGKEHNRRADRMKGKMYCSRECSQKKKEEVRSVTVTAEQRRQQKRERWELAECTPKLNGVRFRTDICKWHACVVRNKTYKHIGFYLTQQEAVQARIKYIKEVFGE